MLTVIWFPGINDNNPLWIVIAFLIQMIFHTNNTITDCEVVGLINTLETFSNL